MFSLRSKFTYCVEYAIIFIYLLNDAFFVVVLIDYAIPINVQTKTYFKYFLEPFYSLNMLPSHNIQFNARCKQTSYREIGITIGNISTCPRSFPIAVISSSSSECEFGICRLTSVGRRNLPVGLHGILLLFASRFQNADISIYYLYSQ